MRFWLPLMFEPPEQAGAIAQLAEELGFEGLALADHLVIPEGHRSVHPSGGNPFLFNEELLDPFVTIASMAATTSTLRFMSFVYLLPLRDPFSVAKQVGTASILSGGRVAFGVGVGWLAEEFAIVGQDWRSRGSRTDEALTILRDLWTDGRAQADGQHFTFPPCTMQPVPPSPIPIWIGGGSEAALRRAARQDGWLGMNHPLEDVHRMVGRLLEHRRAMGRGLEDFEVFVIANEVHTVAGYRELERAGVTATMGAPWAPGDPAYRSLPAKRDALERFAADVLEPLRR